ncbi:YggT family protein [Treponema sp. OttesenSCG-928-L16]|nr:YggT family protein [Treponema sp. OttesenSCG-928-L16]
MRGLMNFLGGLTSIYMILMFIRIMLTWFSGVSYGKIYDFLCRITDPYLDWFRRFPLTLGHLDFSPLLALAVLSLVNNIFHTLAYYGRITLGIILAMLVSSVWAAIAFILTFFIIVLILRLIAYLTNRNSYSVFWGIVDKLAQPVIYRISRIIFRDRLVNYMTGTVTAIACLLVLRIGGQFLITRLIVLLSRMPV